METSAIQAKARPFMEYDMISKYTELPEFPEFRIRLLFAFLQKEPATGPKSELYALVTSLVQMGMDTHDLVPVTNDWKETKASRSGQLKVLAGDYFSSRFYQLLSQAGEIEMVQQLSAAICEVNRLKINLYTRMKQLKLTAEDYIQQLVGIKMQLFLSFHKFMAGLSYKEWPEVLRLCTLCEVLLQEIQRLESTDKLKDGWAYWQLLQSATIEERRHLQAERPDSGKVRSLLLKYNINGQLCHLLDMQVQQLWTKIRQFDSGQLGRDLSEIGEFFASCVNNSKALEEL